MVKGKYILQYILTNAASQVMFSLPKKSRDPLNLRQYSRSCLSGPILNINLNCVEFKHKIYQVGNLMICWWTLLFFITLTLSSSMFLRVLTMQNIKLLTLVGKIKKKQQVPIFIFDSNLCFISRLISPSAIRQEGC